MLFDNILKKMRLFPYILAVFFSGYFAWNAYFGTLGFARLETLRKEYQLKLKEAKEIELKKEKLALKVKRMYSNNIDLDLLDETARQILNFADSKDIIIFD